MDADLLELVRSERTPPQTESPFDLIACSLCLRVLRGSEWMDAERVIREIRSYDLGAPPRLRAAVCDHCAESISIRRAARTRADARTALREHTSVVQGEDAYAAA
jgi:hypothetical protein